MSFYATVTGLTTVSYLAIGIIVFLKNPKGELYQRFLIFCSSVAFWALGYFMTLLPGISFKVALFSSRASHAVGAFIPITFFHFTLKFLNRHRPYHQKLLVLGYIISAVMFFACLTPLVVRSLFSKMGISYYPEWGPLYPAYASLYIVFALALSQLEMARSFFRLHGMHKKRLIFFIVSTAVGFVGGISLFLLIFNLPIPPYASVLIIVFPFSMAYTIIKYREFDIEFIIRKTLVFAGLFGIMMVVVAGVSTAAQSVVGRYLGLNEMTIRLLSILIALSLFDPVRKFLVNLTDRYLFQKKFNLTTIVAQAGEAISLVQSLRWLSRRIVAFLITKCRIQRAVIYTRSQDNENFERAALRGGGKEKLPRSLPTDHFLIQHLVEERRILERQRLEDQLQRKGKGSDAGQDRLTEILEFLKSMDAEVIIPSFLRNRIDTTGLGIEKKSADMELRNILILGGKKSDEPYSDEELAVFYGLAQESAIAIENARLYDEAVQRTKLLVEMNHELEEANQRLQVTQASLIVAEKNATMVGMAKAIGHEVNNPLSTVGGRSIWIYRDDLKKCRNLVSRYDTSLPEDFKKDLNAQFSRIEDNAKRIEKSAKRIEVVVKTLTDILKNTRGEKGPLSLLVLCREAREATRFLTYEENLSGCEITESIGANIIILGNLEQLLQVFINMIKNAYEAMIGRSERKILIRGLIDPREPGMARIEFIDSGPGIPENVLPKIWEQGFSTKEKKENNIGAAGQGQGLFICKHVIESIHNGKIYAESKPGEGTTFVIKLPLVDLEG